MNLTVNKKKTKNKRIIHIGMTALVLVLFLLGNVAPTQASPSPQVGDGTVYVWWLVRLENNQVACSLNIAHDGMPNASEVESGCGAGLLAQWKNTEVCVAGNSCSGLYLHLAKRIEQASNLQDTVYTRPSWLPKTNLVGSMALLSYAVDESSLASNRPLQLLAGKLIQSGMVSTAGCSGSGILLTGAANTCGQERAAEITYEWQNQFDADILLASEQTQIPPHLLKNLFMQESQMWPGIQRSSTSDEYGLGHMTEAGADTLLTWNRPYFESLCSQMLGTEACADGYILLNAGERAILRGIVLKQVGAECATCPWNVDLRLAQKSVPIFAHTLVAYAEQTGQLVYNVTERKPSDLVYSEDMWRFTLANYNGGSACLGAALQATREQRNPLDWVHVAQNFAEGCQQAVTYVNKINDVDTGTLTLPPTQTASIFERWQNAFSAAYVNPEQVNAPLVQVAAVSAPPAKTPTASFAAGEIALQLSDADFDPTLLQTVSAALDIPISVAGQVDALNTTLLNVPAGSETTVLAALQQNTHVLSAEPNYLVQTFLEPDDPEWHEQPYLQEMQIPAVWDLTLGDPNTITAVIDSGVDTAHPDLAMQIWQNPGETGVDEAGNEKQSNGFDDDNNGFIDDWQGWNFNAQNNNVQDDNGHGSFVAGVIGAATNNAEGIAGVASGSQMMILKALDANGYGTYNDVAAAIIYAADQGAQIINLSLGNTAHSEILQDAIDYAVARDIVLVAAAGNSGDETIYYPAAYPQVISVAALEQDYRQASFATFNPAVELAAPGVNIISTGLDGSYSRSSGSSLAAAHVSGAAALLHSNFANPADLRIALQYSARDLGDNGRDDIFGYGLIQVDDALHLDLTLIPTPTPTVLPPTPVGTPASGETDIYAFAPVPTPTFPVPAPTNIPSADDPHVDYNATTASCAACHRGHNAADATLRRQTPEEETCFACHTSGGSGTDVEAAFAQTNTATRIFQHDIYATNGIHTLFEDAGTDFSGTNRHIECEDCHDPHEATRGAASAPFLQREMTNISGVNPNWTAEGAPTFYSWLDAAEREYQVCFKCHTGFTTLPAYAPDGWQVIDTAGNGQYVSDGLSKLTSTNAEQVNDSRDLAQEFNPYNASFHPVVVQGRNTTIPAGAFVSGWSTTSMVYCSDCHTNASPATGGEGPHGSALLHILDGASNYQTVIDPNGATYPPQSDELCSKCHDYTVYAGSSTLNASLTNFRDSKWGNLHGFHVSGEGSFATPCYACHDTHGSEQEHLLNFDTSLANPNGSGIYDSQTAWIWDGTKGTCFVLCHTAGHGTGKSYTP